MPSETAPLNSIVRTFAREIAITLTLNKMVALVIERTHELHCQPLHWFEYVDHVETAGKLTELLQSLNIADPDELVRGVVAEMLLRLQSNDITAVSLSDLQEMAVWES